jgi:hypothetical protein
LTLGFPEGIQFSLSLSLLIGVWQGAHNLTKKVYEEGSFGTRTFFFPAGREGKERAAEMSIKFNV